ncbi:HPr family phosphocarrier protein [Aeoliella mucimassa]|uniref:Phosphocarrier protein HPr n=1 Tax=Aeoliella mucimassa TaxID=2527972 RepID=A0A518AHP3_9BACT|nr:HPr family phosphocarrier protein [Aeoliella mucimassa]QDU54242.1 Phosphocarrier protein HPr [Aeoliella mucimassa]
MAETVITETTVVTCENGLHIRPAEQLVRLANQFTSQIGIIYESQRVDAKSILELLTLGAQQGASVVIEARGNDAEAAVESIVHLFASDFANGDSPKQQ